MINWKLRNLGVKIKLSITNFGNGIIALIFGVQLKVSHLKWLRRMEAQRNINFKRHGFLELQLMDASEWKLFSGAIQEYFKEYGLTNESKVDWALNRRVYLDIENTPSVCNIVNNIIASNCFKSIVRDILGTDNWRLFSTQIWRNYPEDFDNNAKEINSSFYHVDNGGDKENRLFINIFMYLSPIDEFNGPFTFYDKATSHKITRYYFKHIMKYGNLRKYHLTREIENKFKPHLLLKADGAAVAINNQECLHRAGFCSRNYRDIIEFIVTNN
jgi:hypothetical protein